MLQEQIHLLQRYCEQFDSGDWLAARPMSTALRVLLHHPDRPKVGQGSLLAQLRLRGGFWSDSTRIAGMNMPKSKAMSWPQILVMQIGSEGTGFHPKLTPNNVILRRTSFLAWWTEELGLHETYGPISRKKIIVGMADQDGGAHVDGSADECYDAFTSGKYFSITIGNREELARGAAHAAVRTVAHETLLSVYRYAPKAFCTPYQWRPNGSSEINSLQ
jgi:hypothetical protein